MRCNHIHDNGMGINTYGSVQIERNRVSNNRSIGLLLQVGSGYAVHGNRIAGNPEAAIDTATYGATLTDYADNACDRSDPGCTQEGGRQAVAGVVCGPQPASPPPPPCPPLPAPKKAFR